MPPASLSHHPPGRKQPKARTAELLTKTHSFPASPQPLPRKHAEEPLWEIRPGPQQLIVRAGEQEQDDIVPAALSDSLPASPRAVFQLQPFFFFKGY